jgi:hypothetical protein
LRRGDSSPSPVPPPASQLPPPKFGAQRSETREEDPATPRELQAWRATAGLKYEEAVPALREALESSLGHSDKVRRKLFLDMSRIWHPDKNAENPAATQVFQWLQEEKVKYVGDATPTHTPTRTPAGTPRA